MKRNKKFLLIIISVILIIVLYILSPFSLATYNITYNDSEYKLPDIPKKYENQYFVIFHTSSNLFDLLISDRAIFVKNNSLKVEANARFATFSTREGAGEWTLSVESVADRFLGWGIDFTNSIELTASNYDVLDSGR